MLNNNEIQQIKESSFGSLPASKSFINLIYEDINDIKHKFVDIGFRLAEAQRFNYPEELGYNNIHELAEHLFGFKKSTTYSLINVYQRFGSKMKLLPEYEKFSQSQLTEMCSLPEYLLHHVKPDMTIQDIRDYKKAFNELTVFNEDTIKEPKKLIEDYRTSKKVDSRRLEENNISSVGENKDFSIPNYIIQWLHGGEEHMYAYKNFIEVSKVVNTFDNSTKFRVLEIKMNELTEMHCWPPKQKNSEEYITTELKRGSGFERGKMRICHEYAKKPTMSEFAQFLEKEYDLGGRPNMQYNSKGIHITIRDDKNYDNILFETKLNWNVVAKRIANLIDNDNYLTENEKIEFANYQAQRYGSDNDRIKAIADWMIELGLKYAYNSRYNTYKHGNNYKFVNEHVEEIKTELNNRKEVSYVNYFEIEGFNLYFNEEYCKKNKE